MAFEDVLQRHIKDNVAISPKLAPPKLSLQDVDVSKQPTKTGIINYIADQDWNKPTTWWDATSGGEQYRYYVPSIWSLFDKINNIKDDLVGFGELLSQQPLPEARKLNKKYPSPPMPSSVAVAPKMVRNKAFKDVATVAPDVVGVASDLIQLGPQVVRSGVTGLASILLLPAIYGHSVAKDIAFNVGNRALPVKVNPYTPTLNIPTSPIPSSDLKQTTGFEMLQNPASQKEIQRIAFPLGENPKQLLSEGSSLPVMQSVGKTLFPNTIKGVEEVAQGLGKAGDNWSFLITKPLLVSTQKLPDSTAKTELVNYLSKESERSWKANQQYGKDYPEYWLLDALTIAAISTSMIKDTGLLQKAQKLVVDLPDHIEVGKFDIDTTKFKNQIVNPRVQASMRLGSEYEKTMNQFEGGKKTVNVMSRLQAEEFSKVIEGKPVELVNLAMGGLDDDIIRSYYRSEVKIFKDVFKKYGKIDVDNPEVRLLLEANVYKYFPELKTAKYIVPGEQLANPARHLYSNHAEGWQLFLSARKDKVPFSVTKDLFAS
ncbi:MAG: hypothetical protein WC810_28000, partial [Janthinobacterium sp.]